MSPTPLTQAQPHHQTSPPKPYPPAHYIAGIGASAGGLEALEQFFSHAPSKSGIGYVVVQHLSPDYKSLMVELLSKHTDMPVLRAENNVAVHPDRVYLIPPKKNMTILDGRLQLIEKDPQAMVNLPIDIFLSSLAEDQRDRAIGIVLSGTGSDGTRGVRAIKDAGGMIMVQDETSAKFDGMPRSAIATGVADFILPPYVMPSELRTYVAHRRVEKMNTDQATLDSDDDRLVKIFQLVRNQIGVDFTQYKTSTASRRIQRRLNVNRLETLDDYLKYLVQSPREVSQLYKEMLIGVTNFFRDPEAFRKLQADILPKLIQDRKSNDPIRVWCSGCATGEEAYSLAILFAEALDALGTPIEVKIFATDIDRDALDFASQGAFPDSIATDMSTERFKRFFSRAADRYRISRQIREMVVFAPHNLIKDPPFTRIDLISCRNLLIYLQPSLQKKVLSLFRFALKPTGYLLLGSSESVGEFTDQFHTVDSKWKIHQLREGAKSALPGKLDLPHPRLPKKHIVPRTRCRAGDYEKGEMLEAICRALIDLRSQSCIVVNSDFELIYVFGDVQSYVSFRGGVASLKIMELVPKELAMPLSTSLHRAQNEGKPIFYKGVVLKRDRDLSTVDLSVNKLSVDLQQRTYYFILLETGSKAADPSQIDAAHDLQKQATQRFADLENDLQFTRENLQATIEELETSNEELQATNEELLSSNEELQSTNEELQSVNEELYTVNTEYQNKIQEMTDLTNDVDNLLRCTDIGSVFLDEHFIIRRYTPAAVQYVNLLEKDVGRHFFDLTHRLRYARFADDARFVLDTQDILAKEVKHVDGESILVKIFPYLDELDNAKGIVINFVELSAIKKIEMDLMRMQKEKDLILDTVSDVILYYNNGLELIWANRAAFEALATEPKALIGLRAEEIWTKAGVAGGEEIATQAIETRRPYEDAVQDKAGGQWLLKAIPILDNGGPLKGIVELARPLGHRQTKPTTKASHS